MSDLKELAVKLFDIGGLKFGEFDTKVGFKTPFYLDLRSIVAHPALFVQISKKLLQILDTKAHNHFCGVPYTALPLATIMSAETNVPMILRRKEIKAYGTKKMLEGEYRPNDRVVIVDDVIMSGASVLETVRDLKAERLVVTTILAIVDREQGGVKTLRKHSLNVRYIFTITQMMDYLHEAGRVTAEQVKIVKEYVEKSQISSSIATRAMSKKMDDDPLEELAMMLHESGMVVLGDDAQKLSERKSIVHIDFSAMKLYPGVPLISKQMTPLIKDIEHDFLCAVSETVAIPLACHCRMENKEILIVDRSTKKLIGHYKPGDKVIIVLDALLGDGTDVLETLKFLEQKGLKVVAVVSVIDDDLEANKILAEVGIKTITLFTINLFASMMLKMEKITKTTYLQVKDYPKTKGEVEKAPGVLDGCKII